MNRVSRALALALGACTLAGTAHAATQSVAYWSGDASVQDAWIVSWNAKTHRAHVVARMVQGDGSYSEDGAQRTVTFDGAGLPTYLIDVPDCHGNPMQQQVEITQTIVVVESGKASKGTSLVSDVGYTTDIGGCTPGQRNDFDWGAPTSHLDLDKRPGIADLTPGTRLAGPSESPVSLGLTYMYTSQVGTLGDGAITMESTGHVFPLATIDGWLVLDLGTSKRGYTRLSHDAKTGLEAWLISDDWNGRQPGPVALTTLVVPNDAAGFGKAGNAAHVWNEGMFMRSPEVTEYDLYRDLTGLKVTNGDIADGLPVTWSLAGADLVIVRPIEGFYFQRTWVPLADVGKYHYVMESEDIYYADGRFETNFIPPRVNWYVDEGKASKP